MRYLSSNYWEPAITSLPLVMYLVNRAKSKITYLRSQNNFSSSKLCILTTSTNLKNSWKRHTWILHQWWILTGNSSFLFITSSLKKKAKDSKLCSTWLNRSFHALCKQIVHSKCYHFVLSILHFCSILLNKKTSWSL